tara:strand:+ start:241 stop:417 length:177 start_codon:yes stop_codon:yes gene_type:complete
MFFEKTDFEILKISDFSKSLTRFLDHDDGRYEKKFRSIKSEEFDELSRALLRIWSKHR